MISDDKGVKYPLFSYRLTPDIAIVDSSFCDLLPPSLVAFPGIDAITHAVESFVSVVANEFTEINSLQALELLIGNLEESYNHGTYRKLCVLFVFVLNVHSEKKNTMQFQP